MTRPPDTPPPPAARGRAADPLAPRLWLVPVGSATEARFAPLLSAEEQRRAARFRQAEDRARFTVGRGALRLLLGRCLALPPDAVAFRRGPHGRPHLACETLDFNVAHAGRVVLCAVAREGRVGVDVEAIRVLRERHAVVALACDRSERAWLERLPAPERRRALFELWTAKEACLKAAGCGLSEPPAEVAVALDPDGSRLPARTSARFAGERFALRRLPCPPGYRATLATAPRLVTAPGDAAAAPGGDPTGRRPRSSSASPPPAGRA